MAINQTVALFHETKTNFSSCKANVVMKLKLNTSMDWILRSLSSQRQNIIDLEEYSPLNKLNDLIHNLTPENMTQHSRIE